MATQTLVTLTVVVPMDNIAAIKGLPAAIEALETATETISTLTGITAKIETGTYTPTLAPRAPKKKTAVAPQK